MSMPGTILISRTDSIGDVMLTLPLAGILKEQYPGTEVVFLGKGYTAPVLACCSHVDRVVTREDLVAGGVGALKDIGADAIIHVLPDRALAWLAVRAGISVRIGTSHCWWHWFTANARVPLGRRNSDRHEAQLNAMLLGPLGIRAAWTLEELVARTGFSAPVPDEAVRALLRPDRERVILHPGSQGSAVEWGLERFAELVRLLPPERYQVIITGTAKEGAALRAGLPMELPQVTDATGLFDLHQLITLIGASDALVAASTGPLHIAAACGIRAVGLYSPRRPIHPGRWAPIGRDAHALVNDPDCARCAKGDPCDCIGRISPQRVLELLER